MNDLGTSKGTLLLISFYLLPYLAFMAKNAKAVCFGANIIYELLVSLIFIQRAVGAREVAAIH